MVSRRAIQLKDRTVLFSPDDPVPSVDRIQALVKLQITDELTGRPPDSQITIDVRERAFVPRVANDGLGGLVGIPRQVFPALKTMDYFVHLTVRAERYMPRNLEVKVAQNPSFPATFTAPQNAVALHREPVFISGRTVRLANGAGAPLAGTQVRVTGIWRTPPPANVVVSPDPPNIVALEPPLYSDRVSLTQFLRPRDLPAVTGNDKALMDDLPPGANPIQLSNRQGLSPGNILLIDAEQPDLVEFMAIKSLLTTAPVTQPTLVTLDYPLVFPHRRGAVVQPVNPQAAGANRQFTVDALSGDTCVFLDALTGLTAAQQVEVTGAPGPDEYHNVMGFTVTSDADGYYRLPPLSRVAQLEIHAEKTLGPQTFKATTTFRPDYQQRENRLDFILAV